MKIKKVTKGYFTKLGLALVCDGYTDNTASLVAMLNKVSR